VQPGTLSSRLMSGAPAMVVVQLRRIERRIISAIETPPSNSTGPTHHERIEPLTRFPRPLVSPRHVLTNLGPATGVREDAVPGGMSPNLSLAFAAVARRGRRGGRR
jgi:hypothetical protein